MKSEGISEHTDQVVHTWAPPEIPGLSVLSARFRHRSFPRHAHDFLVVGTSERGSHRNWSTGSTPYGPENVVIIPPGVVHTGETVGDEPWEWRAFYLLPEWFAALDRRPLKAEASPRSSPLWIDDATLRQTLLAAHRAFSSGSLLQGECLLLLAMSELLRNGAPRAWQPLPRAAGVAEVELAREYLRAHFAQKVTLSDLAVATGVGAFRLLRAFEREQGLTPHAFQVSVRVERARELLRAGMAIADVAGEVGFADQSHLTRHFNRLVGTTPGRYVDTPVAGRRRRCQPPAQ